MKEKLPDVPTAALVEGKHPQKLLEYLRGLKVDAYNLNDELVDKESVEKLREAGFFVGVYTVNDAKRAKELFNMGVNCVFSDSLAKIEMGIL
jgi:glycerophosphoryl diester phosphodiesterase